MKYFIPLLCSVLIACDDPPPKPTKHTGNLEESCNVDGSCSSEYLTCNRRFYAPLWHENIYYYLCEPKINK